MKRVWILTLLVSLVSSHGMIRIEVDSDTESLSERSLSSKSTCTVIPSNSGYYSTDEYVETEIFEPINKLKLTTEFRRRNSTQVDAIPITNTDSNLFKEKLEFYDKFPKEAFNDSDINYEGWMEEPSEFCVTMLLSRHVGDKNNLSNTAHTGSKHSEINLETVGIDKALSLMTLGYIFKFDAISGGTSDRHDTTARLISSFSPEKQNYQLLEEFDEQKLGHLGGKHEKEILKNPEFIRMFNDKNYKMKLNETEVDEESETGSEVINRFTRGIDKIIDSVKKSRNNTFLSASSHHKHSRNMLLYICSSRCTLNWMIKHFTDNMDLPLQLKSIQNCNLFCVNYYPNSGRYQVLLDSENMPYCVSPLHFSLFALKSPVFQPFIQTFCQKVSRIIQKQEEDEEHQAKHEKKLIKKTKSETLLRTVYLKMLSQSFSHHPETTKKPRSRSKTS